ncbi:2,3-diphosphoglycerate-dependent phosphoglycerate mutase [Candidatus Peregrinibacteria bacterium]|nr:2,3-diphosphoglycerate-dependent phosphoglycerate mutase [Candidatus Peregrinibacteria bacterium]
MNNYLILVRHGQSVWNLENLFTGWTDVELSEQGRAEATAAGKMLAKYPCDVLWTSVLKRAWDTLDLMVAETGWKAPVVKTQALNERHYGDLQGLNKAETAKKFGDEQVHLWRRSYDVRPPNGESLKDTVDRVRPVLENCILPSLAAGKNLVVVAHGNSNRAMIKMIENISDEKIPELELETGKPYFFQVTGIDEKGGPILKRVDK